ncbi:MAG: adenine deaminase [candidate division NC10 bacterium]|nr:adenine deaminase [candidate division NC10 bacterium]
MKIRRLRQLIAVARGQRPADLVLRGGRVANVFTGELLREDVAIVGDRIAGLGRYAGRVVHDVAGGVIAPGLVDGHFHLESTMLTPAAFARAVVPRGTTAVVMDPHEIGNVAGISGIRWLLAATRDLPLTFHCQAPSCVPASRLETTGGRIGSAGVRQLLARRQVLGLAEMMDYRGLLAGEADVLRKLAAAAGAVIDGHAPGLAGPALNAYLAAGPASDHESVQPGEAREKLRRGAFLMLRQSSVARDMTRLLPTIPAAARDRCLLVTDDLLPHDLLRRGHLDAVLREAMRAGGLQPVQAIRMVTLNPAAYLRLPRVGAVAPGWRADLVVFEDLRAFRARLVIRGGRVVARGGRLTVPATDRLAASPRLHRTVHVGRLSAEMFRIPARPGRCRAIRVRADTILTDQALVLPRLVNGVVAADPAADCAKLAVVERHVGSGRVGLGLVVGLGLRAGALATSVAHDCHNLVVAGMRDEDMLAAAREIQRMGGGLVAVQDGEVLARLPLPVAGLLTQEPLPRVAERMEALTRVARRLGVSLPHPFLTLSFVTLAVVPRLKLTDRGLVDVDAGRIVPLWVE